MKNIEDIFKNKLDNHGMPYDETYWQAMENLLDEEPKKRGFFKWGYAAALLIGFVVCLIGFFVMPQQVVQKSGTPNEIKNTTSQNTASRIAKIDSLETKKVQGSQNLAQQTVGPKKTTSANSNIGTITTTIAPLITALDRKVSHAETNLNSLQVPMMTTSEALEKLNLRTWWPVHFSQFKLETVAFITSLPKFSNGTLQQNDTNRIAQSWLYYLALTSEYDWYTRDVNKQLLKTDEQTLNRVGYNLQFMAQKNRWGIKTGIGLLQLAERTNYQSINKSYSIDTVYKLVNPNYGLSPNGNLIALIKKKLDTTTTVWNTVANPNALAQFTYLKIPLMANYEMGKKRFRFYVEAGLNTAICLKQKGYYTTFENNQYRVVNLKNNNLSNAILFQSYMAFGVKYAMGKSFNIVGGYGFSKGLNSMVKGYVQKPNSQFFNLGLELKL